MVVSGLFRGGFLLPWCFVAFSPGLETNGDQPLDMLLTIKVDTPTAQGELALYNMKEPIYINEQQNREVLFRGELELPLF